MSESLSAAIAELAANYRVAPRIERKFIVKKPDLGQAERLVRLHPLRFRPVYERRQVNNIYLDTAGFKYYNDSIAGLTYRLKVRIRWYGSLRGNHAQPRLEIKLKNNLYVYKLDFRLGPGNFDSLTTPELIARQLQTCELPGMVRDILPLLRPVLANSYSRRYWQAHDPSIRLTMDEDLQYFAFHRCTDTLMFATEHDYHTILEVKYHPDREQDMEKLTDTFLPRISRYSKYTNGVDLLFQQQSLTD